MNNLGNAYLDEIKWFIECYLDDSYEQSEDKEILLKLKEEDLKDVVYKMIDDSELNECLNSTIRYYLFHR